MHAQESNLTRLTIRFTREDRRKSWLLLLSTLFLAIFLLTGAVFFASILLKVLFGIFAGLCIGRLFVIYHDYNHEAILTKSPAAKVIMRLFGVFILAPVSIWNRVHDYHHEHNSQFSKIVMGSFPIISRTDFESLSRAGKMKYLFIRHPSTIALSYFFVFIISFCLYPFFENPKKHWDGLLSVIAHVLFAVGLFQLGGFLLVTCCLILPFSLMGLLGGYIFYAQHNFPGVKLMEGEDWNYSEAALKSSSYIKMSPFWSWVTANVGYHHVHHINSRIPFYRLPEAMHEIPALQSPTTTSLRFKDIKACLSLKLWDSEAQKMISLSEVKG